MHAKSFDLGILDRDTVVTVVVRARANIRLMTEVNYLAYRRRQLYKMLGGVALTPELKLTVPTTGHWFLVVDVDGLATPLLTPKVSVAR
ncbi:hypothetical protein CFP71_15160 [Amycolatopsis thailandensis]|uniref:DUF1883 domain-containing protein n=1 Tax=Amycolatopsis thailandensis TaxID=589330 RepID=A0A229SC35_9PSEU|nr:DUF1883 domain-containing protein [Amycolatopsis thailandensis]OXM56154.1 hypothetical protein CFP71_15160 [Amycolatopsis thailandensis]